MMGLLSLHLGMQTPRLPCTPCTQRGSSDKAYHPQGKVTAEAALAPHPHQDPAPVVRMEPLKCALCNVHAGYV